MQNSALSLSMVDRMTLSHFRKHLPRAQRSDFNEAVRRVLAEEAKLHPDPVTAGHVVFAAGLMCSVSQWQAHGLDRPAAKAEALTAVTKLGQPSNALAMWLTALLSKDVFLAMKRHTIEKSAKAYGPTFEFGLEESDDAFVSLVHVCGYRTFLARHGADDLISLFCEWDRVWINALPRGVGFARPATLAQGAPVCRFEFTRE